VLYNIIFVVGRAVFWEINKSAPAFWYTLDYLCDFIYLLDTLVHMHEGEPLTSTSTSLQPRSPLATLRDLDFCDLPMQMRPAVSRLQTIASNAVDKAIWHACESHFCPRFHTHTHTHTLKHTYAGESCELWIVGVVGLPNAGDKPTLTFCTIATNALVPLSFIRYSSMMLLILAGECDRMKDIYGGFITSCYKELMLVVPNFCGWW